MSNFNLTNLSDAEIINLCNEIYDWKRSPKGILCENSKLIELYDSNPNMWVDTRNLEQQILIESEIRFHKLVALLFSERPTNYIK